MTRSTLSLLICSTIFCCSFYTLTAQDSSKSTPKVEVKTVQTKSSTAKVKKNSAKKVNTVKDKDMDIQKVYDTIAKNKDKINELKKENISLLKQATTMRKQKSKNAESNRRINKRTKSERHEKSNIDNLKNEINDLKQEIKLLKEEIKKK